MVNYNNCTFVAIDNRDNGKISSETILHYKQTNHILTAHYQGGKIISGYLIGIVNDLGEIDMRYHQINAEGQLMTGKCISRP